MRGELRLLSRRANSCRQALALQRRAIRSIARWSLREYEVLVKQLLELFAERANLGRSASQPEPAARNAPATIGTRSRSICFRDLFLSSSPTGASTSQLINPATQRVRKINS